MKLAGKRKRSLTCEFFMVDNAFGMSLGKYQKSIGKETHILPDQFATGVQY